MEDYTSVADLGLAGVGVVVQINMSSAAGVLVMLRKAACAAASQMIEVALVISVDNAPRR